MRKKDHFLRQNLRRRYPLVTRAEGCFLFDDSGRRIIDGASGVVGPCTIGHAVPEIIEAMAEQARKLSYAHISVFDNMPAIELADFIIRELAPRGMEAVYFVSTGTEATELAIKLARMYHVAKGAETRFKVISRRGGYHGSSLAALAYSGRPGRRRNYHPYFFPVTFIPAPYCYRCPCGKQYGRCGIDCALELERAIKYEDPNSVSAFIAEPVVTTMGAVPAPKEYFKIIREICDRHDVVFVADEVVTGFGRTGRNFAIEHWDTVPDIIACGKAIAAGYAPLAAAIVNKKVVEGLSRNQNGTTAEGYTYGGNPLSTAVGLAVQRYVREHDLIRRAALMGRLLLKELEAHFRNHPHVGDIRGKGLLTAIELVKDRRTKTCFPAQANVAQRIADAALGRGLSICPMHGEADGQLGDNIIVKPPFIVTENLIEEMVNILARAVDLMTG